MLHPLLPLLLRTILPPPLLQPFPDNQPLHTRHSLLHILDFDNFTSASCLEAKNKTDPTLDCDPKVQGPNNVWWMAKDLMKYESFSFAANVLEGGVTIDPTAGAFWGMSPYVTGNYTCRGTNGQTFTLATDVRINADPPFSMSCKIQVARCVPNRLFVVSFL